MTRSAGSAPAAPTHWGGTVAAVPPSSGTSGGPGAVSPAAATPDTLCSRGVTRSRVSAPAGQDLGAARAPGVRMGTGVTRSRSAEPVPVTPRAPSRPAVTRTQAPAAAERVSQGRGARRVPVAPQEASHTARPALPASPPGTNAWLPSSCIWTPWSMRWLPCARACLAGVLGSGEISCRPWRVNSSRPRHSWNHLPPPEVPCNNLQSGSPDSGKGSGVIREEGCSWPPRVRDSDGLWLAI